MSYTVYPYLVNLDILHTVYGCQDHDLLVSLEARYARRLQRAEVPTLVWIRRPGQPLAQEQEPLPRPTLRQALRDIIAGTVRQTDDAWQYWYAFELLCDYYGHRLPNEHYEGIRGSALGVLQNMDGLQDLALSSRFPLPFPLPPPPDFPAITYLKKDEIATTLNGIPTITLATPFAADGWTELEPQTRAVWEDEWEKRLMMQYRQWLMEALRLHLDVVALLY